MIIDKKMDVENCLVCKSCFEIHLGYLSMYYHFEWHKIINVWYWEDSSDQGKYMKVIGEDRNQQHTSVKREL